MRLRKEQRAPIYMPARWHVIGVPCMHREGWKGDGISHNSGFTGSGRCAPSGPTWILSCLVLAHESRQAPSSVKRTRYPIFPS